MTTGDMEPYTLCNCHTTIVRIDYAFNTVRFPFFSTLFLHHQCWSFTVDKWKSVCCEQPCHNNSNNEKITSLQWKKGHRHTQYVYHIAVFGFIHIETILLILFREFRTAPRNAYVGCKVCLYCTDFPIYSYFKLHIHIHIHAFAYVHIMHPIPKYTLYTLVYRMFVYLMHITAIYRISNHLISLSCCINQSHFLPIISFYYHCISYSI